MTAYAARWEVFGPHRTFLLHREFWTWKAYRPQPANDPDWVRTDSTLRHGRAPTHDAAVVAARSAASKAAKDAKDGCSSVSSGTETW